MKQWQSLLLPGVFVIFSAAAGSAQSEDELKRYFEGKSVEVRIDMPATKYGIDVYAEKAPAIDFNRYGKLIKANGISVREGDRVMITKIKVKDKHIEFQLGGGYGTFGDETNASVSVPPAEKSRREKNLENDIKNELDANRRHEMRR